MKEKNKFNKTTIIIIVVTIIGLFIANRTLDDYKLRIINLCGIYITLGLSMNLINGFTGLFSLGHAGFMAIGAYTVAILTMPIPMKEMNFFMKPMVPFLANLEWSFLPALLMAGVMAGLFGFLIGAPVLRLTDDYLAIATLGFAEIIRVVFTNTQSITNGALGLKGIPNSTNVWWSWGTALITIGFMVFLMEGSYGKAFKAIREDEIAARSMGINLFKHKVMSFTFGSFLAGIGGGLLAALLGTIDPNMFRITLTFNILLIVVLGGLGSIKGSVISAIIVTVMMEALRFLDESINLGFVQLKGVPGMRMVVFSIILMVVVIFRKEGLLKES
ncbi:branched-chain amino acid ABC transporter permease [Clostridium sp. Cult1]|jgi:branched-chain amino acid transport system permease protein|uniref:branched-chain amino acid ABC transporter permease n=1 Tax=Clostridium sp. Cult1 TaxID=2079002 RepID=UPI001F256117|nr:branched-chain amino acid ABC transporter permease [Clostridium sp. Cult1]MCF6463175.1 branched-chain amino acid ABC transporter permease [Clostridium sp. Cult1]